MHSSERQVLRHNHVTFTKDLEPTDLVFHLKQDAILTDNDIELITGKPTRRERVQTLLTILPTRGPTAYGAFKKSLNKTSYDHLADLLNFDSSVDDHPVNHKMVNSCSSNSYLAIENITFNNPFSNFCREHCCLIVDNVEPKEVVDYFYASGLLNEDQCDRIHNGVTRKDRCSLLLSYMAEMPAEQSLSILRQSLQHKYSFISEQIDHFCESNLETAIKLNDVQQKSQTESHIDCEKKNKCNEKSACDVKSLIEEEQDLLQSKTGTNSSSNSLCVLDLETEERSEVSGSLMLSIHPGSVAPFELPSKKLALAFNHMSCLINQGRYHKFDQDAVQLKTRYSSNPDMLCLISYLKASKFLFGNKLKDAKQEINYAFDLVPKTTNPKYFTLELFSAKTRMYITQKKLKKLDDALEDIKQLIETDPVGCKGRAAGWLHMNDARSKTSQMAMINLRRKPKTIQLYNKLHCQAKASMLRAITNFREDGGKDGPFGCGFAICRLAILLLRCGDNGLTMDTVQPDADDVELAGKYLRDLEELPIPMAAILDMHFKLAKCDYHFRKSNTIRAVENAERAYAISQDLSLMEFVEHAHNRLLFLRSSGMATAGSVMKEDVMDILLRESSESY